MGNYIFDIDGTLAESGKPIAKSINESIEMLLEKGNKVAFASARPIRDMLPMISENLRNQAILIGCNGGMAFQNGAMLYCKTLADDYVAKALSSLRKLNIPYVLDGVWGYAFSQTTHPFQDYIRSLSDFEEDEQRLLSQGVTKILILSNATNINDILPEFENEQISLHLHTKENFFDLTVKGHNKYNAIINLFDGEYTAFGNDKNDFLMLDNAKYAVFVGSEKDYKNTKKTTAYLNFDEVADFIKKLA